LLPLTPRELEEPVEKRRVICVLVVAVMDEVFSMSPTGRESSSLESSWLHVLRFLACAALMNR
jgi:hypothetical protein